MLGELQMTPDGEFLDKVELAIRRLKAFEPEDGYFVAFSGGKDSQCVYHLCKLAGVKFDAHYSVTSVDPPELVHFIKNNYPDVSLDVPKDKNGNPVTMWNLIARHTIPPTRKVRYCCAELKEPNGIGRVTVTGVRWGESLNRAKTHGVVGFSGKKKNTQKMADDLGTQYQLNKHGEVVLNDDNDASRRMVEQCYRNRKTIVNPIVDWSDTDVWEFLNERVKVPHCSLYDEGFTRLGCIGCPLSGAKNMRRDFERWPKYKELYMKAFQRMVDNHPGEIKILQKEYIDREKQYAEDHNLQFHDRETPDGAEALFLYRNGSAIHDNFGGDNAIDRMDVINCEKKNTSGCSNGTSTTATMENGKRMVQMVDGVRLKREWYSTDGSKWVLCDEKDIAKTLIELYPGYEDYHKDRWLLITGHEPEQDWDFQKILRGGGIVMTIDRAIEILNPEHRERYDSLETVKEACRMGMEALEDQKPVKPRIVGETKTSGRRWGYCGMCGAGLRIAKGSRDAYCWRCGREVDWNENH